jgi:hypothetical protein
MRVAGLALFSVLFLAGCAVPPALTVASFVADGVSYVATGKSTTDHAISAVMRQDCALLRVVQDKALCDPDGEVLVELVGTTGAADENGADPGDFNLQDHGSETVWKSAREVETVELPR